MAGTFIGGKPLAGPPTPMETLGRSKVAYDSIKSNPKTNEELAVAAPVIRK
jgi:hypothetical protein